MNKFKGGIPMEDVVGRLNFDNTRRASILSNKRDFVEMSNDDGDIYTWKIKIYFDKDEDTDKEIAKRLGDMDNAIREKFGPETV